MIGLIMRFYDPQFGQVLVNDKDVREYNINELRGMMGLVMQEPTLFNYTIRENILYGKMKASNEEVYECAKNANALSFIEDSQFGMGVEDDVGSMYKAMVSKEYQESLIEKMGKTEYNKAL